MNIIMISAEATPFSKTGGLADVVGGLSLEIAAKGNDVRIIVPAYKISAQYIKKVKKLTSVKTFLASIYVEGDIYSIEHPHNKNITVYFVANDNFFDRDSMYMENGKDYDDNIHRFTFFSKCSIELIQYLYEYENYKSEIVHLHDWHVALVAFYIKEYYKSMVPFDKIKVIFSIHNIAFQGIFSSKYFNIFGISWDYFNQDLFEFYGNICLLKSAIICSDHVTTVSKNYAKEVQTAQFGFGLENILKSISDKRKFTGVLNGVHGDDWRPDEDKYLGENTYTYKTVAKKNNIKNSICGELGFDKSFIKNKALISMIARFDIQKGIDLIDEMFFELSTIEDAVFVFLFTKAGDADIIANKLLNRAKRAKNISVIFKFDERLSHLLTASSDIFLMPSRFEPCGLNQMYSMIYGTVPIVYEVGGLRDTVIPYKGAKSLEKANGFTFKEYSGDIFIQTIEEALSIYHDKPIWNKIIENGMASNFSMSKTADEYIKIYQNI